MKFSNNNSTKQQHVEKFKNYVLKEQMQRNVSEDARKRFNRKPYQIGGYQIEQNSKSRKDA